MRLPAGVWKIGKEILRHLLRRPVVGICAIARTTDGRYLLIRRADSGGWALPGGTLEWGETLRDSIERELHEETGAPVLALGGVSGVFSAPARDPRFHAVTVVVHATVGEPAGADNPLEVVEVRLFAPGELPDAAEFSHGMADFIADLASEPRWE